jgi:DNA repair exonuclease SbcCD ATPase subunit
MTVLIGSRQPESLSGIKVDSPEWFAWLEEQKSFRFECSYTWHIQAGIADIKSATCTVIKQGKYWNAQKRVSGQLRRYYLGTSDKLTYDGLCEAAKTLTINPKWCDYLRAKQSPSLQSHKKEIDNCETEDQDTYQTSNPQARLAELEKENEHLKGRISYLLDERGLAQAKVHDDARFEIERLKKLNKELERENIQLNRVYSQSEDISRKYHLRATSAESQLETLKQSSSELQVANQALQKQLSECSQQANSADKEEIRRLNAELRLVKTMREDFRSKWERAKEDNGKLFRELKVKDASNKILNRPDPAAILNRLRKERKNSKADLKDIELILELIEAITL